MTGDHVHMYFSSIGVVGCLVQGYCISLVRSDFGASWQTAYLITSEKADMSVRCWL
jgi:hypothetical protein